MNGTKSNPTSTSLIDNGNVVEFNKDKTEVFAPAFASVSSSTNYSSEFQRHKTISNRTALICSQTTLQSQKFRRNLNKEFAQPELKRSNN